MEIIKVPKQHRKETRLLLMVTLALLVIMIAGIIMLITKVVLISHGIDLGIFIGVIVLLFAAIYSNIYLEGSEVQNAEKLISEKLKITTLKDPNNFQGASFMYNLYYAPAIGLFCKPESEFSLRNHEVTLQFFSLGEIEKIETRVIPHNFLKPVEIEKSNSQGNTFKYSIGGAMVGGIGGAVMGAVIDGLKEKDEVPRVVRSGFQITLHDGKVLDCFNYNDKLLNSEIKKTLPPYLEKVLGYLKFLSLELEKRQKEKF